MHHSNEETDFPPLPLAHEAGTEENWCNAAAIMRQERSTVAEDSQDDCCRDNRGSCRNEDRHEGDEHRSDMRAVAGQQIMRHRIDDAEDNEHRKPRHAGAGGSHRRGKPFHEAELREIRRHVDKDAHPYEDIPGTMLFRDVAPVNALRDEHCRETEQCNNGRIDVMDAACCPEKQAGNKDNAEDFLFAAHAPHLAEFFFRKGQGFRRFRKFGRMIL